MALRIADDDGYWELIVPLDLSVAEALRVQMARIHPEDQHVGKLRQAIADRMARSILEVLDFDLKPPTQSQISYAIAIARDLNVNLPGEALLFRGAMSDFINRYSQLFKERHARNQ